MAKVLVAEADKNIRELYRLELEEEGHSVIPHSGGAKLIEAIEEQGPDVVILDLRLRGCDGRDVLKQIRQKFRHVRVIVCSAYSAPVEAISSRAPDHFVSKSSDLTPLKRAVATVLRATPTSRITTSKDASPARAAARKSFRARSRLP